MGNYGVERFQEGSWKVWTATGCERESVLAFVKPCCEAFLTNSVEAVSVINVWKIHGGERSTIYGIQLDDEKLCIKLFHDTRLQTRLRTFLGFSKGRRAFRNALKASERNISVPSVYFYAEKWPFGPTFVAMKLVDAKQMNLLLEEMLASGAELASDSFFIRMIESFARFTFSMHETATCHDDFSPRNVLVSIDGDDIQMTLIDLEDVVFSCKAADFKRNIEHFTVKMARYVDLAAMEVFRRVFEGNYGKQELR